MAINLELYEPDVQYNGLNTAKNVNISGVTTVAASTALTAGGALALDMGSTAAAPNIYWGSGAPTVTAPQGSLYLRSDGSSTSTRAYINTDAGTTWTPITTVG